MTTYIRNFIVFIFFVFLFSVYDKNAKYNVLEGEKKWNMKQLYFLTYI